MQFLHFPLTGSFTICQAGGNRKVCSQREGSIKVDVCKACAGVWVGCEANAIVHAVFAHAFSAWSWNVQYAAGFQ